MSTGRQRPGRGRGIGTLFRRPAQAVQSAITAGLAGCGFGDLTEAHMAVFIHVAPDGSRLTDLAARAQMTVQSMGYLVDALQERGYLERVPDPSDRRAKLVRLTGRGWEVEECAAEIAWDLERRWASLLGEADFGRLRELLEALGGLLGGSRPPG